MDKFFARTELRRRGLRLWSAVRVGVSVRWSPPIRRVILPYRRCLPAAMKWSHSRAAWKPAQWQKSTLLQVGMRWLPSIRKTLSLPLYLHRRQQRPRQRLPITASSTDWDGRMLRTGAGMRQELRCLRWRGAALQRRSFRHRILQRTGRSVALRPLAFRMARPTR